MARISTKKFDYGKGIYYFVIKKDHNSNITIKRSDKQKAIVAYANYLKTYKDKCEWLGKWDGKKFVESDFNSLEAKMFKEA
ncbi:MAG TPA: hypothetical protein P5235_02795 [Saprospiraceae bacterium]|nr:hypothetical protein [Saprospiraceae bacterium]